VKSLIYALAVSATYYFYGYEQNKSYGYGQIQIDSDYLMCFSFAVFFGALLFWKTYRKPSDYFLLLYGMIIVIPYALLHDIQGGGAKIGLVAIVTPFLGVLCLCKLKLELPHIGVFSEAGMAGAILLLSVLVVSLLLLSPPNSASFSLVDSYHRRLESRELYGSGTVLAYAASIVMNGLLPLMAFWGVLKKRVVFILVSVLVYVSFYYVYGVKAPVMYMVFAGVYACVLKLNDGQAKFFNNIYYGFLLLFTFAWLEFWFFDYSYSEDYIIRRVFYVGSYLVGVYVCALGTADTSLLSGLLASKPASMYIGEDFLGHLGLNANTNTFLYFFLQFGIFGYFFAILLVGAVMIILNSLRFRGEVYLFISLMFGVLILEQSVTTVLVSSGIGGLIVLFYFSRQSKND